MIRRLVFLMLLLPPLHPHAFGAQQEAPPIKGDPEVKVTTVSRVAGDPGELTSENAPLYRVSDGTNPLSLTFEQGRYTQARYDRTTLNKEALELNQKSADFNREKRERQRKFFEEIRSGNFTGGEIERLNLAFAQEEKRKQEEFNIKQRAEYNQLLCAKQKDAAGNEIPLSEPCKKILQADKNLFEKILDLIFPFTNDGGE